MGKNRWIHWNGQNFASQMQVMKNTLERSKQSWVEKYVLIEHAKAVYDWAVLADILQNYSSLSEAKVALYEKHKKDLKDLKKLVRENLSREEYQRLFAKKDEKANYYAYIKAPKQCSQEDFYGYLKKNILGKISDVTKASCMQKEMEMGTFLPKQTVKDNSVIPYQIHLYELNAILKNLEDKVPLLKENGEKIQKIFTFPHSVLRRTLKRNSKKRGEE